MIEDHLKLYRCLKKEDVKYMVIGGIAAIAYGVPRTTNDIDIFVKPSIENCTRLLAALKKAGFGTAFLTTAQKISENELTVMEDILRIDILTEVKSLEFDKCWKRRKEKKIYGVTVNFISLGDLIKSKRAVLRIADKEDIKILKKIKNTGR